MGSNRKPPITWSAPLSQKMAILALIITLLPIAIANVPSTSAQSNSEPVYLLKYVVSTTSDWTDVTLEGLSPLATNTSILSGAATPGLWYYASPGQILIGKNGGDVTPVSLEVSLLTLRGSDYSQISIVSGSLGQTVVDIYLYSGSWIKVSSITHLGSHFDDPLSNRYNFTVDYRQIYASPSGSAEIEGVPSSLNGTVFAFYYPWYGTSTGPSGQRFHWNEGHAHMPALGHYDSMDERVIGAHISMAKAAGIDGFIVSWWGPGTFEDRALPTILRVAEDLNFQITIYYESYRFENDMTIGEMADELSYVVQTYSNSSAFLKANGMPVIFIYAVPAYDRSPSFWTGVVSLLEGRVGFTYMVGDFGDSKYAVAFDGCHAYSILDPAQALLAYRTLSYNMKLGLEGITWDQAIALIQQGGSLLLKERFVAFTVQPGYDDTGVGGTVNVDRKNGQTYNEYWQGVLSSDPDGVLITSWNEWHEGSEIEPSIEYGFTYLNLTRQYVSLYKGTMEPIDSPALNVRTVLGNVMPYGAINTTISLINDSPSAQAIYVNLSISLSEGLELTRVNHKGLYCYIESINPHTYSALIPLVEPGETLRFNITLATSIGSGNVNVTATAFSPSGVVATASTTNQFQVVQDNNPPTITDLTPANGTSISSGPVNISASFYDDTIIDTSSVVLKVDGAAPPSGVQVSATGLTYTTSLQPGTHSLELTVEDTQGNSRTVAWNFVVTAPPSGIELWMIAIIIAAIVVVAIIFFFWNRKILVVAAPKL